MSQQDIEIVRRSFDAWNEGNIEAIRGCYADDVVIEGGTQLGMTLDSDDPVGHWVAETQRPGRRSTGTSSAYSKATG